MSTPPPDAAKTTGTAETTDTDKLRKDLEQLRKDFATLSEDVQKTSRARVESGVKNARSRFDDSVSGWCDEIEARPFTSILTAFGVGLLLGKIFSR